MNCTCKQCRKTFEAEGFDFAGRWFEPNICNDCDLQNIEHARQQRVRDERAALQRRFEKLCPAIYRNSDPQQLPDRAKAEEVLAWAHGPRGLVVHGHTRRGKSRAVWMLLAKCIIDRGLTVEAFTDGGFALAIAEAYGESADASQSLRKRLCSADILFIDDFGKCKLTDRVEAELFAVIEARTSNLLPIIVTTNGTRETFTRAFSDDRRDPILERLREFCQFINFK